MLMRVIGGTSFIEISMYTFVKSHSMDSKLVAEVHTNSNSIKEFKMLDKR